MPMTQQNEVRAFAGENRLLIDSDLPDNVSPDALNCDYSRATIRKRDGFTKLHTRPALEGGIRIDNDTTAKTVWIPYHTDFDTAFDGDFTIESWVLVGYNTTAFRLIFQINGGTFNNGWALTGSSGVFAFTMVDSGGTPQSPATFSYTIGKWHHVVHVCGWCRFGRYCNVFRLDFQHRAYLVQLP